MHSKKMKKMKPYLSVVAIMLILSVFGYGFAPVTFVEPITRICIFILIAMSTNILLGYMGMMPLGQSIFIGISAYSYTIFLSKYNLAILPAILLAMLITLVSALFIGYFCLLHSDSFAGGFIYLGFNTLLTLVCTKMQYLGYEGGLNGGERIPLFSENRAFLVFVVLVVGVLYLLIYRMMHSPAAKVIQGVRDNSERVTYLGINVFRFRLLVFCISALLTGAGGILYSMFLRGAYPNMFNSNVGLQCIMMCILGGMTYFYGPTIGAVIGTLLFSQLSNMTLYWQGVIGIILVLCVLFFRDGFLGFCNQIVRKQKLKLDEQKVKER